MKRVGDVALEANRDVADIARHVHYDRLHNEVYETHKIVNVYHYVVSGTHVDPDLGCEYVPVDEPLKQYRRRKIGRRNSKVRKLVVDVEAALESGQSGREVQRELNQRQQYPVVSLVLSLIELQLLLTALYSLDYVRPRCLEGGYIRLLGDRTIVYDWEEGLSCFGGVTDRYGEAEFERQGLSSYRR